MVFGSQCYNQRRHCQCSAAPRSRGVLVAPPSAPAAPREEPHETHAVSNGTAGVRDAPVVSQRSWKFAQVKRPRFKAGPFSCTDFQPLTGAISASRAPAVLLHPGSADLESVDTQCPMFLGPGLVSDKGSPSHKARDRTTGRPFRTEHGIAQNMRRNLDMESMRVVVLVKHEGEALLTKNKLHTFSVRVRTLSSRGVFLLSIV